MFSFKYLHKNKINSRPTMNCWVVICECKSFPFSASTPFPAVGVFLLRQLHFFLKVSSSPHSVCKVLLESCPRGPSAGLKLGLRANTLSFRLHPQIFWVASARLAIPFILLMLSNCGGSSGVLLFQGVFSHATFKFFFPQHNQTSCTVKWQAVKCFIQWNIYTRARFIF